MKKYNLWTIVHLSLLAVASVFCVVSMALLFSGHTNYAKSEGAQRAICDIFAILALIGGGIYALKGYGKDAKTFYNAFFSMLIVATAVSIVFDSMFFKGGAVAILLLITSCIKAVFLLLLTFLSDLGKAKAWIFFLVVLAMDVVGVILMFVNVRVVGVAYTVCACLARLLIAASIGLVIRGKYVDKVSRGR